jgi:hypothetical protein
MNPNADTAIRVEEMFMRSARAAAVMTPADQAIQEPEAPFAVANAAADGSWR